ncbi:hypothetical protein KIW84_010039 [Lathyrus oleraceus]|uniref:Uncharacterized protein n=1 Tax=Pisum sativum TaxID=3888 RepID=A0A9D5B982_PEA|nr:hypothetical protein KIW84_010039 [Pisum sativum]
MFILKKKLKLLKCKINDWNKIIFGNIHKNVRKAKICLQEVQNNIVAQSHSDYLIEKENHAQVILDNALFIVDLFWKEKARVRWYAKGDWNTKYFHMIAKIKNAARGIHSIKIDDTLTIDPNKIATHDSNLVERVVPQLVNDQANNLLTMLPSQEEIHGAVFSLNGDSVRSPDGFGPISFQTFWSIIKEDVIIATMQFFTDGWIQPNYNSNTLVLIPKVEGVDYIEKYMALPWPT